MASKGLLVNCCFCLPTFGLLVTGFVFLNITRHLAKKAKADVIEHFDSWKLDAIFSVTATEHLGPFLGVEGAYVVRWQGEWPGLDKGCYCSSATGDASLNITINKGACNYRDQSLKKYRGPKNNCRTKKELEPVRLAALDERTAVFVVKVRGTSLLDSHRNKDALGRCLPGFRDCAAPGGQTGAFCVSAHIPSCPVSAVATVQHPGFAAAGLSSFELFFTTQPGFPIVDATIVESHSCLLRSRQPVTPGRRRFKLLLGNSERCTRNPDAVYLHDIGEKTLFEVNKVPSGGYSDYLISDQYRYRLAVAPPLPWFERCRDKVGLIARGSEIADSMTHSFFILVIVASISLSVACFVFLILLAGGTLEPDSRSVDVYTVWGVSIFRFVCNLLILAFMVRCSMKVSDFLRWTEAALAEECSTAQTTAALKSAVERDISKLLANKSLMMLLHTSLTTFELYYEFAVLLYYLRNWSESNTPSGC